MRVSEAAALAAKVEDAKEDGDYEAAHMMADSLMQHVLYDVMLDYRGERAEALRGAALIAWESKRSLSGCEWYA